jgi:hypothetical protein
MPSALMMWPRYFTCGANSEHFWELAYRLFFSSSVRTLVRCASCIIVLLVVADVAAEVVV